MTVKESLSPSNLIFIDITPNTITFCLKKTELWSIEKTSRSIKITDN